MDAFGAAAPLVMFGIILGFALAGPVADLIVRRRVHPAYLWGLAGILATDLSIPLLAFAPPTTALVRWIGGA